MNQKSFALAKGLAAFTQIGLSTAVPVVLIMWGASALQKKFGLGNWVLFAGIVLGLSSGLYGFYKEARILMEEKPKQEEPDDRTVS